MPRRQLSGSGGFVFHVMNRAVHGLTLFHQDVDYDAFLRVLAEAGDRHAVRLLAYCVMPNHWHLVVTPERDDGLSQYMHWLTGTHALRWRTASGTSGRGAVYQGRYRWVPVEQGVAFLRVCMYVERNAVRARLTRRAEQWRWSSAWQRDRGRCNGPALAEWPVLRPDDWTQLLNEPWTAAETDAIRVCVRGGRPYGTRDFCSRVAALHEISVQPRGRPASTRATARGVSGATGHPALLAESQPTPTEQPD